MTAAEASGPRCDLRRALSASDIPGQTHSFRNLACRALLPTHLALVRFLFFGTLRNRSLQLGLPCSAGQQSKAPAPCPVPRQSPLRLQGVADGPWPDSRPTRPEDARLRPILAFSSWAIGDVWLEGRLKVQR